MKKPWAQNSEDFYKKKLINKEVERGQERYGKFQMGFGPLNRFLWEETYT